MTDAVNLLGRLLISVLFFGGAAQKFIDPAPVQGMLTSVGLPETLVGPIAVFNLIAGLGLLLGPKVQLWAIILALYCVATSYFHWQLRADPWQMTIFVKNWSIAGGLLVLAAQGPGRWVLWR